MRRLDPVLTPSRDVERRGAFYFAVSDEAWLSLDDASILKKRGRFIEIVYRASFWDAPVRPVFRFELSDGTSIDRIGAGPVAGAGIWIGRMPAKTVRVRINPTNRPGPFSFTVEAVRTRRWPKLLLEGFGQAPRPTRSAILTRLIGWPAESDNNLAWATGSTKLADYAAWRLKRERPIDLGGIDKPRFDWNAAPPILMLIDATALPTGGEPLHKALRTTLDSLDAQVFPHWRALVISNDAPLALRDDARLSTARPGDGIEGTAGLIGSLKPGDRLPAYALACVAEAANREPGCLVFYGDEDVESAEGTVFPVFKPGWSSLLQRQRPFLGRSVFLRTANAALTHEDENRFASTAAIPDHLLARLDADTAKPIRRILLHTRDPATPLPRSLPVPASPKATAALIIPTRDQAAFLRRAIDSARRYSRADRTSIIVIDNGSVEVETKIVFDELSQSPNGRVIPYPGPFNFSQMCNQAAAATDADVLVFLNNDTEVLSPDWLDRLTAWALQPDIGAVGAKLTYPDGRLQHIGVLLGMGESAGHFGSFADNGDAGWAMRNEAIHDVTAVTGACVAIARSKFEAVGGFDSEHLPIELSDIDLCLKLSQKGWRTIVDPMVHLTHYESASRGRATFRRLTVYESQRAVFKQRWHDQVRDDPFFHPGLSLFDWKIALG